MNSNYNNNSNNITHMFKNILIGRIIYFSKNSKVITVKSFNVLEKNNLILKGNEYYGKINNDFLKVNDYIIFKYIQDEEYPFQKICKLNKIYLLQNGIDFDYMFNNIIDKEIYKILTILFNKYFEKKKILSLEKKFNLDDLLININKKNVKVINMNLPDDIISNILSKYFSINEKIKFKILNKNVSNKIRLFENYYDLYFLYSNTNYLYYFNILSSKNNLNDLIPNKYILNNLIEFNKGDKLICKLNKLESQIIRFKNNRHLFKILIPNDLDIDKNIIIIKNKIKDHVKFISNGNYKVGKFFKFPVYYDVNIISLSFMIKKFN